MKIPHASTLQSEKHKERFLREAKAAAQMRHPNIVPIYEAGVDGDTFYIVSAFIKGQTLRDAMEQKHFDLKQSVKIVRDLAGALAYAHEFGIVHRDVKPENIMLDARGEPLLMDFGLVRFDEPAGTSNLGDAEQDEIPVSPLNRLPMVRAHADDSKLTQDGAILGTPAYMSPEQAMGSQELVGPASDQYSLGVILYEFLCGQAPFSGPVGLVLSMVINQKPPAPTSVNPQIPPDLEAICLKAISKTRGERYADCRFMAADLRHWSEGEPIDARQITRKERVTRWCKKNPLAAWSAILTTAIALIILLFATVKLYRLNEQERTSSREFYYSQIINAYQEYLAKDTDSMAAFLDASPAVYRNWEWGFLKMSFLENRTIPLEYGSSERYSSKPGNIATLGANKGPLQAMAFSLDGKRQAIKSADLTMTISEVESGRILLARSNQKFGAFSPDGNRLVSFDPSGIVTIWDIEDRKELLTMKDHLILSNEELIKKAKERSRINLDGYCAAFSPDGRRLACGTDNKTIKIRDAGTGQELNALKHERFVSSLAFSPDGELLACDCDDSIKIWDAITGREISTLSVARGRHVLSFSADGSCLASGNSLSDDHDIKIWDAKKGRELLVISGHKKDLRSLTFSPDGKRLASGSADSTVKIWDAETGRQILSLRGHTDPVISVSFSPDNMNLISGSDHGKAIIWKAIPWSNVMPIATAGQQQSEKQSQPVKNQPLTKEQLHQEWNNTLFWSAILFLTVTAGLCFLTYWLRS